MTPRIECQHCGSHNVEVERVGKYGKISRILDSINLVKRPMEGGQYRVRCKDCGKEAILMLR